MIEFSGEISQVVKVEVLKRERRYKGIYFAALALLFFIAMFMGIVLKNRGLFWASCIVGILILLIALKVIFLAPPKKFIQNIWNLQIIIDIQNKKLIYRQMFNKGQIDKTFSLKKVKKVYKYPYYYQLKGFALPMSLILEHSLLKRGTYVQLEQYFQNNLKDKT